jgi:hypothetical protein
LALRIFILFYLFYILAFTEQLRLYHATVLRGPPMAKSKNAEIFLTIEVNVATSLAIQNSVIFVSNGIETLIEFSLLA